MLYCLRAMFDFFHVLLFLVGNGPGCLWNIKFLLIFFFVSAYSFIFCGLVVYPEGAQGAQAPLYQKQKKSVFNK